MRRLRAPRMGGDRHWPVIVLLAIAVLVPSATVLWLTDAAVRNERAAIRGRWTDVYRQQLDLAARQIDDHWRAVDRRCESLTQQFQGRELFHACVEAGIADSVIVMGEAGRVEYPDRPRIVMTGSVNEQAWDAALHLEFVQKNYPVAADAYAVIAGVDPDPEAEAKAWVAHARCLEKSGRVHQAVTVLIEKFNIRDTRVSVERGGRVLEVDAKLRAVQLLQTLPDEQQTLRKQQTELRETLEDYSLPIPASQRIFAMEAYGSAFPDDQPFPMLPAERLAASLDLPSQFAAGRSLWGLGEDPLCVPLTAAPLLLVFRQDTMSQWTRDALAKWQTDDTALHLVASDSKPPTPAIGETTLTTMSGRRLVMTLRNPSLFDDSSSQQTSLYTLASFLTIAIVLAIAILIAVVVRRQLQLAQLKNDLAAVVTHELRTPLASVRVLVDTLLEGTIEDEKQRSEYLQLIAQENERLGRLIENFLAFSRIHRGKPLAKLQLVKPADLVQRAVAATGDKLTQEGCRFYTEVPEDLPSIQVDEDAMVMVLLNLLDNAVKFTGESKTIKLSTSSVDGFITFDVCDNGIGMSAAESRRVFDKFFQADTKLTRNYSGCGLGLSLVQSIVKQHGGSVAVESSVGGGSTFRVSLPIETQQGVAA